MWKSSILFSVVLLVSCSSPVEKKVANEQIVEVKNIEYPKLLKEVFEKHGGLKKWQSMEFLSYEIEKNSKIEKHAVNLKSRKTKVSTDKFAIGYDGSTVWKMDPDSLYKGNPEVYYNLYFYFYAMPFVLADDGIQYKEMGTVNVLGKNYDGVAISYNDGVGASPKDEYFILSNPETNQMEWLGYTFTYGKNEISKNHKWIQYKEWETVNGILLPKIMQWYTSENNFPKEPKGTVLEFKNPVLSKKAKDDVFFKKP